MKVSVFGLGYVGTVSAGCLAKNGHEVVGVDTSSEKVEHVNAGESPILEDGIGELISVMVAEGRLSATSDAAEAVARTDLSIVCVGTPGAPTGKLDLSYLTSVSRDIGAALRNKSTPHTVVVRSTVLPGTVESQVVPTLEEASGRKLGDGYHVFYNPEFLREGTSIADFFAPPMTLVGVLESEDPDTVRDLYREIDAPFHIAPVRVAEMLKYSANAFHALKISFANEIGRVSKRLGADSHAVMDLLCRDTKLNISRAYLRPGFAFGGSCLPKDLRALTYEAKELDVAAPVLGAIVQSNDLHGESAVQLIRETGHRKIGLLGLSFKAGTDDLRESPCVTLAERLIGKGYELQVYDPLANLERLVGANKAYILRKIPRISRLMASSVCALLDSAEVVVIGNTSEEFKLLENHSFASGQVVIDLVGMLKGKAPATLEYHGLCW